MIQSLRSCDIPETGEECTSMRNALGSLGKPTAFESGRLANLVAEGSRLQNYRAHPEIMIYMGICIFPTSCRVLVPFIIKNHSLPTLIFLDSTPF